MSDFTARPHSELSLKNKTMDTKSTFNTVYDQHFVCQSQISRTHSTVQLPSVDVLLPCAKYLYCKQWLETPIWVFQLLVQGEQGDLPRCHV